MAKFEEKPTDQKGQSPDEASSSDAVQLTRTLVALERNFWKSDADFYERHLSAAAVMALPVPAGILRRDEIVASIAEGQPWAHLRIINPRVVTLSPTSALLTYRAQASRKGDSSEYLAVVSSAYVLSGGEWQLAFHQQTPEPSAPLPAKPSPRPVTRAAWGAVAIGACAMGAVAVGTLAIGRVAIGAMQLGRVRVRKLAIDELTVNQVHGVPI